ncbi:hypothetical protein G9A89_012500 [Geosiphon pyriformis]|nr:hypothetical protein G9A89_012500 [Geosiphon pyriformis]
MYNTNIKELFKVMGFKTTSVFSIKVKPKIFQFQSDSPKLTPTDVTNRAQMTFPNSPTIAHSTFTISLTPGVNNIDIWVSVPIMTTEYGGGVNGIFMVNGAVSPAEDTQAERYYIFIKK